MGFKGKSKGLQRELAIVRSRRNTVEEQINLHMPEVQKGLLIFLMGQPGHEVKLNTFKEEMYRLFETVSEMSMKDCKVNADRVGIMAMAKSGLFHCPKGWGINETITLSEVGRQYGGAYQAEIDRQAQADAHIIAQAQAQAQAQADAQAQIQASADALARALAQDRGEAPAPSGLSAPGELPAPAPSGFHALADEMPIGWGGGGPNSDDEVDDQDSVEHTSKKIDDQDNFEHSAEYLLALATKNFDEDEVRLERQALKAEAAAAKADDEDNVERSAKKARVLE